MVLNMLSPPVLCWLPTAQKTRRGTENMAVVKELTITKRQIHAQKKPSLNKVQERESANLGTPAQFCWYKALAHASGHMHHTSVCQQQCMLLFVKLWVQTQFLHL